MTHSEALALLDFHGGIPVRDFCVDGFLHQYLGAMEVTRGLQFLFFNASVSFKYSKPKAFTTLLSFVPVSVCFEHLFEVFVRAAEVWESSLRVFMETNWKQWSHQEPLGATRGASHHSWTMLNHFDSLVKCLQDQGQRIWNICLEEVMPLNARLRIQKHPQTTFARAKSILWVLHRNRRQLYITIHTTIILMAPWTTRMCTQRITQVTQPMRKMLKLKLPMERTTLTTLTTLSTLSTLSRQSGLLYMPLGSTCRYIPIELNSQVLSRCPQSENRNKNRCDSYVWCYDVATENVPICPICISCSLVPILFKEHTHASRYPNPQVCSNVSTSCDVLPLFPYIFNSPSLRWQSHLEPTKPRLVRTDEG